MTGFGPDHLPYAVTTDGLMVTRLGDLALPLADLPGAHASLAADSLDALLAAGPAVWAEVREWLQEIAAAPPADRLLPVADLSLRLPFTPADYVDFYASEQHASNVGRIFRPDQAPLLPNWKHLPVGYHGRAGTVVVSGTDIVRPSGQRRGEDGPVFGPSQRLDIEAELGFVVGVPSVLGTSVTAADFAEHVFGVVGLNDWSARDVQAWEYVPLGPFLGKSFATSISAWVTPLAALEAAWCDLPGQDPTPLEYLRVPAASGLDISVEVLINGTVVSRPPYASMYWSPAQMLAHMTVNGASLRTGDLFGSGTISGPEPSQFGSLLELSWGWQQPFAVGEETRTALVDGDTVTLRYTAPSVSGGRLELGEVTGTIRPAR